MTAVATGMRESRSSPRWLMPVLVGSLALNLIVIGAAGSLVWRGDIESRRSMAFLIRCSSLATLTLAMACTISGMPPLE